MDGTLFMGRLLTVALKRKNIPGRGRARGGNPMMAMMNMMMRGIRGRGGMMRGMGPMIGGRGGPRGRGGGPRGRGRGRGDGDFSGMPGGPPGGGPNAATASDTGA